MKELLEREEIYGKKAYTKIASMYDTLLQNYKQM